MMFRLFGRFFPARRQRPAATDLYDAGKSLTSEGKLAEAQQNFLKVIELDPNCEGARYRLIEIEQALNKEKGNLPPIIPKDSFASTHRH